MYSFHNFLMHTEVISLTNIIALLVYLSTTKLHVYYIYQFTYNNQPITVMAFDNNTLIIFNNYGYLIQGVYLVYPYIVNNNLGFMYLQNGTLYDLHYDKPLGNMIQINNYTIPFSDFINLYYNNGFYILMTKNSIVVNGTSIFTPNPIESGLVINRSMVILEQNNQLLVYNLQTKTEKLVANNIQPFVTMQMISPGEIQIGNGILYTRTLTYQPKLMTPIIILGYNIQIQGNYPSEYIPSFKQYNVLPYLIYSLVILGTIVGIKVFYREDS